MRETLDELFTVLAYSRRTQLVLVLGCLSFIASFALGAYMVGNLNFHGALEPLTGSVREVVARRYERLAWVSLGGFMLLAVRFYIKDHRRLYGG